MDDYPDSVSSNEAGDGDVMPEHRDDGPPSTLVPRDMFPDAKVGDIIKCKVIASMEDDLEVEHAKMDDKESKDDGDGDEMGDRLEKSMMEA